MPTKLADIMTRHPITVGMNDTVRRIGELFEKHGFHHLLVLDEDQNLAGIVSDRDYLKVLSPFLNTYSERDRDTAILDRKAHLIMSHQPKTAGPDLTLEEANRFFIVNKVSCLPIVLPDADTDKRGKARKVIGIVTWRDILKWNDAHLRACDP